MAFRLPEFNLLVDIYTQLPGNERAFRMQVPGNLSLGRRKLNLESTFGSATVNNFLVSNLLMPKGTDVRDARDGDLPDIVDVPAGTGSWYWVLGVGDMGKGFSNEYRLAVVSPAQFFTVPYPAP